MQVVRGWSVLVCVDSAVQGLCGWLDHQHAHSERKRELQGMLNRQVL